LVDFSPEKVYNTQGVFVDALPFTVLPPHRGAWREKMNFLERCFYYVVVHVVATVGVVVPLCGVVHWSIGKAELLHVVFYFFWGGVMVTLAWLLAKEVIKDHPTITTAH
jgi:hypothetical protein